MGLVSSPSKRAHQPWVCASRLPSAAECLRLPRRQVLHTQKSAPSPPRGAGDCPCALSGPAARVRRDQDRRKHVHVVLRQDNRAKVTDYSSTRLLSIIFLWITNALSPLWGLSPREHWRV